VIGIEFNTVDKVGANSKYLHSRYVHVQSMQKPDLKLKSAGHAKRVPSTYKLD